MMTQPANSLEITTPSDREITLTRAFNAPRELVFTAYTEPQHVRHWWGFRGSTMLVCEADVRPGGAWRYVTSAGDGSEVPFKGEYLEVMPPARVVYTEVFDVPPFNLGDPAIVTITFEEENGRTLMTQTSLFPSKEVRDAVLQSGMEVGAAESMDRLAELLATLS